MRCIFIQWLPEADAASAIPFPRSCLRGLLGPRLWSQWLLAGLFFRPWLGGPKARLPVVIHGAGAWTGLVGTTVAFPRSSSSITESHQTDIRTSSQRAKNTASLGGPRCHGR